MLSLSKSTREIDQGGKRQNYRHFSTDGLEIDLARRRLYTSRLWTIVCEFWQALAMPTAYWSYHKTNDDCWIMWSGCCIWWLFAKEVISEKWAKWGVMKQKMIGAKKPPCSEPRMPIFEYPRQVCWTRMHSLGRVSSTVWWLRLTTRLGRLLHVVDCEMYMIATCWRRTSVDLSEVDMCEAKE